MGATTFSFEGGIDSQLAFEIDASQFSDTNGLKALIASNYGVVIPAGISNQICSCGSSDWAKDCLSTKAPKQSPISKEYRMQAAKSSSKSMAILSKMCLDPQVCPWWVTTSKVFLARLSYSQRLTKAVYPDHLGNNQRLFEKYGPLVQTDNMGKSVCQTNDPELAQIVFAETEYFSKEIVPDHPLFPIKDQMAGVFLGDTNHPSWKIVHKFLPPALGPKAVRHYAPIMNSCCEESYPVFDELEKSEQPWNGYQYMLKLSSGTVGKIMMGKDFGHFESRDAPLNRFVLAMAEHLAINKKIASRGEWYAHLPFGDPVRLKNLHALMVREIEDAIKTAKNNGTEDLPLQDAALKAANVIGKSELHSVHFILTIRSDYLVRATDSTGQQLPLPNLTSAVMVACGAGFTTTSSLLSWCLYGFVTYPGVQARLLQELIDHDITDTTSISAEQIDELTELDHYVKEMQRRHNPSYQPGRTAQKDMILPGGYRLRKGQVVIPAIHHIHNNAAFWENPGRFDPDRWDTDAVKNRHKSAYIP